MPVDVTDQPVHEKPIVGRVADGFARATQRDRVRQPLIPHAQPVVTLDGSHELPCGDQFLVTGEHLVAQADGTVVVFPEPVLHGPDAQSARET